MNLLERVGLFLPGSVTFDSDLYTSEDHLFATSEINAELHDITIFKGVQTRLLIWLTEPDVVQERAAGT